MPYLHLKRAQIKTTKLPKSYFQNVVGGAIKRPIILVNSQKQRLMALFFVGIMAIGTLIPTITQYEVANAQYSKKEIPALNQEKSSLKNPDKLSNVDPKTKQSAINKTSLPEKIDNSEKTRTKKTYSFDESKAKPVSEKSSKMQFDDGMYGERVTAEAQNTKQGDSWKKLDLGLKKDKEYSKKNQQPESLLDKLLPGSNQPVAFNASAGKINVQMQTLLDGQGLTVSDGKKTIQIIPLSANKIKPIAESKSGREFVAYNNVWKDVDLEYDTTAGSLKESIVIKTNNAPNIFKFKINGGELVADKDGNWSVKDSDISFAQFSVSLMNQGPISNAPLKVAYKDGIYSVQLDANWLKSLPKSNFPVILDPNYYARTDVGGDYGRFWNAKSDGYTCGSSNCWMNLGSLVQAGAGVRNWHTSFQAPYGHIAGKYLAGAYLHTGIKYGTRNWIGYEAPKTVWVTWLPAFNYNYGCCGAPVVAGTVGVDGWIDVTPIYQWLQARGDYGGWLTMWSEENGYSYKLINPSWTLVDFYYADYNSRPSAPSVISPQANQVFNETQPSFQMSPSNDANGDALKYWFRVMGSKPTTCESPTNTLIDSGEIDALQWTIPDGVLKDGEKYYMCGYVNDHAENSYHYAGGNYWNWSAPVEFTVDLRLGKDKTQTYDSAGPVDIALSNGNVSMSASSNTMSALGGTIGVGLEYNSPMTSRKGLDASYWSNNSFTGNPVLTRVDGNVDFDWGIGTPSFGIVPTDNFSAKWEGYFIAPETAAYQFGGRNDDSMSVIVDGKVLYTAGCCQTGTVAATNPSINLNAGQIVPIRVEYVEATGAAYSSLKTMFNGKTVTVSKEWLRTKEAKPTYLNNGLQAKYYRLEANDPIAVPTNRQPFLSRLDSSISFDWGTGTPVNGGPTDRFVTRWSGYVTVPQDATYQFCVKSDDGARLSFDGQPAYIDKWVDQGNVLNCGSVINNWKAGQAHFVTLDYYENVAGAAVQLLVNYLGRPSEVVPSTWLTPGAKVVPDGWSLGIDPTGSINYESLKVTSNGVNVLDNTGEKHFFTAVSGSQSYKPPVDETANLLRNNDGTFVLLDGSGRTYEFSSEGVLTKLTTPQDDRQPTALRYEYAGSPSRIVRIIDGVDPRRKMEVYYKGDVNCPVVPSSFTVVPNGMICGVRSTDGGFTNFFYNSSQLARIETNGGVVTDFSYDGTGMIKTIRSPLSNDLISYGKRLANDQSINTQINYDLVKRASEVKMPAASVGEAQISRTFEYTGPSYTSWSAPENLTDQPTGSANLVNYGEGRIAVFARFGSELKWKKLTNGNWSAWESLGACMLDDPSAVSWESSRIDVFIRGCDNQLYTKYYINGTWSAYVGLGSTAMTSSPSATTWGFGRIDLVAKGPSNELMHRWYGTATGWSGFGSLGGCISQAPTISTWGVDRLNIYVQGCGSPNNFFGQYWQPGWSGFVQFTPELNISSSLQSITSPQDRNIQVVARGGSGDLRYLRFDGSSWDTWQTVQGCIIGSPAITNVGDKTVIVYKGCDGNLYQTSRTKLNGTTKVKVSNASQPNGFSQKIEYDNLGRTVKNTDLANLTTTTEWDPFKDIQYSTTDPLGMKSTIIYNENDMVIDNYGPAPSMWFGSNRKPITSYVNQVSHTMTNYDEGLVGPAVSYFAYKSGSLTGSPKLRTTGTVPQDPGFMNKNWATSPIPIDTAKGETGFGVRETGVIKVPTSGIYYFSLWHNDGTRMYINNQVVVSDWAAGAIRGSVGSIGLEAGKAYDFMLEYYDADGLNASTDFYMSPGSASTSAQYRYWSSYLTPNYGLVSSTKTFDSVSGDVVTKTVFGTKPELAQAQNITENYGGLDLTTNFAYEPYQTGSLMRQTSKTMPGGNTYSYTYYGATEVRANPCVANSPSVSQAGFAKGKIEPDPDGTGSQTSRIQEMVYDISGRQVALRLNNDPWTCISFDEKGRIVSRVIPEINSREGRTVTNNFAVGGNPLVNSQTDSITGTTSSEIDLLGRTLKEVDSFGYVTTASRDSFGRVIGVQSIKGLESYTYDSLNRLVAYAIDSKVYATIAYDNFSQIQSINYPQAVNGVNILKLTQVKRDALSQTNGVTFTLSDGKTFDENLVKNIQTGRVTGYSDTFNTKTASAVYGYDSVGRLTSAKVDSQLYEYGFGTQDASCNALVGYNPNANKNGNRTSYSITDTLNSVTKTTNNCYDYADRTISSTDTQVGVPVYDDHGNITQLAGGGTPIVFTYSANDQNTKIKQGNNWVEYIKTSGGSVIVKKEFRNGLIDKIYRNASGVLLSCSLTDENACTIADKYFALPGSVGMTINTTTTYSVKNFHGDTAITLASNGTANSSVFMYEPFGQQVTSVTFGTSTVPNNSSNEGMGWAANPVRKTESMFSIPIIQMGSRVYLPTLGRFMQVDPVEGGTPSAYAYVLDPVNFSDYSGNWGWSPLKIVVVTLAVVGGIVACVFLCAPAFVAITTSSAALAIVGAVTTATAFVATRAPSIAGTVISIGSKVTGAGSRVATKAPSPAPVPAPSAQITINKLSGKAAENLVSKSLTQQFGSRNVISQPYFRTDLGRRFPDFQVLKNGEPLYNIEVKSGNAKYGGLQELKDLWIQQTTGIETKVIYIP